MLEKNDLTVLSMGVVVTRRPHHGGSVCRLWTEDRHAVGMTLRSWEFPSGSPTPAVLRDVLAVTTNELNASFVTVLGVQGVLLG
jgi:hypothetical protein